MILYEKDKILENIIKFKLNCYDNIDIRKIQEWSKRKYSVEIKLLLQGGVNEAEKFHLTLPFGHVAVLLKNQSLIHKLFESNPNYKYWIEQIVEIDIDENGDVKGEDSWVLHANILHFASRFFPQALHLILSFFEKKGDKQKLIDETHKNGNHSPLHCAVIQPEYIGTR